LGDIGNRLDIEDCEREISQLRDELRRSRPTGGGTNFDTKRELARLQSENDELKLYLATVIRILQAKEVCTAQELEEFVNIIDSEDGFPDGKYDGPIA
jgi:hypothetical protein